MANGLEDYAEQMLCEASVGKLQMCHFSLNTVLLG